MAQRLVSAGCEQRFMVVDVVVVEVVVEVVVDVVVAAVVVVVGARMVV